MGQQTRIVLIDDDQDACELLKMQLEDGNDISLTFSTNSDDAVPLISKEQPDIAILDINMPGTHGVEVGAALAAEEKTASIPVLYLSGMVTPEEVTALLNDEEKPSIISKGSPVEDLILAIRSITSS
jgi:putative two-component system response regulator